jgi:beta-lactamase regulating signal transducer with metallopeptidase domain
VLAGAMLTSLVTSMALTVGWNWLIRIASGLGAKAERRFWVGVGILPAVAGACAALLVVVPGYLKYEPRDSGEHIGAMLASLAVLSAAMIGVGLWRSVAVLVKAARLCGELKSHARKLNLPGELEAYELPEQSRVSTVVGVTRPTMFFSKAVLTALNEAELDSVLRHEKAHVRSGDNSTALVLDFASRLTMNPVFARAVRSHWMEAAEIAADLDAVRNTDEALDLLSALVKVAKLKGNAAVGALGCSFVPKVTKSHLRRRIESLQALADGREIQSGVLSPVFKSGLVALAIVLLVTAHSFAGQAHAGLELLMK